MNKLVDYNSAIYFIGFQHSCIRNTIELLFDIYNDSTLSCRLHYTIKDSEIPKLLKYDESGVYGELFDRYDLDLHENRIYIVKPVVEYEIIDALYYNKKNECPLYIYILSRFTFAQNYAITIPDKIHFYISFIIYLFQENFGDYNSYSKYMNWVRLLNINLNGEYIDDYTPFKTYHTRRIITSRDGKINIETNTITFEHCEDAFDFLQLVNDSNVGDIKEYSNSDDCSENCFISSSDNYPENYFKIRKRKITVLQKDWDVFKLLAGEYNRYVFIHYKEGHIRFVVPHIVK